MSSMVGTALGSMPYEEYLQTARWKALAMRVKADRGRCESCGSTRYLQVHHVTYERLGRERYEDLQVLCRTCHHELHVDRRAAALYEARLDGWVSKVLGCDWDGEDYDYWAERFDRWLDSYDR